MYYADLRQYDATNGTGVGTTLFVSGCNFHCPNCFNKDTTWDFNSGKEFTKEVGNSFLKFLKIPEAQMEP